MCKWSIHLQTLSHKVVVIGADLWCNVTFNNISAILWQSVLLVEESGVPRENHQPVASHWQTLSLNVAYFAWAGFYLTTLMVIATDYIGTL
jgi:hypothetical protein